MKPEPTHLRIDRDGAWFANGIPVTHEKILKLFRDSLVCENGACKIVIDQMENPVEVEDAPLSVRAAFLENTAEGEDIFWLALSDDRKERLDPATLRFPEAGAVYCMIQDGRNLQARFSKTALQHLSNILRQNGDGSLSIELNGEKYKVDDGIPQLP